MNPIDVQVVQSAVVLCYFLLIPQTVRMLRGINVLLLRSESFIYGNCVCHLVSDFLAFLFEFSAFVIDRWLYCGEKFIVIRHEQVWKVEKESKEKRSLFLKILEEND